MKITKYDLPAYWASALINDDQSGLNDSDITELNTWCNAVKPGACIDVSEDSFVGRFNGLITDMATYSFTNFN